MGSLRGGTALNTLGAACGVVVLHEPLRPRPPTQRLWSLGQGLGNDICFSVPHPSASGHTELTNAFSICSSSFSQDLAEAVPSPEMPFPMSKHFQIWYILASTATMSCAFSLGLYLLIWGQGELGLLISKLSSED